MMNVDKIQDIMDDNKTDNEDDMHSMIGLIGVQPCKVQTKLSLEIYFSNNDIIKHALDGPLYIARRFNHKPTNGILIDPLCVENFITKEFLFVHEIYQDSYEQSKTWIKTHDGFAHPTIALIILPLKIGLKQLNLSFSIILMIDQFHVKLGYPWLCSMNVFLSVIHKCSKFTFDNQLFIVHHSGFNLLSSHWKFSLDLFWSKHMEPIACCKYFFFK
jgi:hypothetical protein